MSTAPVINQHNQTLARKTKPKFFANVAIIYCENERKSEREAAIAEVLEANPNAQILHSVPNLDDGSVIWITDRKFLVELVVFAHPIPDMLKKSFMELHITKNKNIKFQSL